MFQLNDYFPNMGAFTQRRGDSPNAMAETGPVLNQDAESVVQSIPELLPYSNIDWRPAFDRRLPGLLYSSEAVRSLRGSSNVIKMGEAYHECTLGFLDAQEMHNTTPIGKGYYMKAMTPRAVLEMEPDSPERPDEEDSRTEGSPRYVSPNPSELDEMARAVLRSGSPWLDDSVSGYEAGDSAASTLTAETDAALWASEREFDDLSEAEQEEEEQEEEEQEEEEQEEEEQEEEEQEEEEQEEEEEDGAGRPLTSPLNSLADLMQSTSDRAGSEETTSKLEEPNSRLEDMKPELEDNKPGLAGGDEGEEAKLPETSPKKPPLSSLPDPIPLSGGTRGPPTKERSSGLETAQRHLEHIATRLKSMMLDPARHNRPPTAAEKGKWRAECECPVCQPQQRKRVRFDSSAMDKAEDGPGLSQQGFVKMMMENRRRIEADPRGEGCSSWATVGPTELAWLCMFTNPRPAPQMPGPQMPLPVLVPGRKRERRFTVVRRESARKMRVDKRDIGEPRARYSLFPLADELPSSGPTAGSQTTPLALQRTHETSRRKAWVALSKRFKEVRDSPRWIPRIAAE